MSNFNNQVLRVTGIVRLGDLLHGVQLREDELATARAHMVKEFRNHVMAHVARYPGKDVTYRVALASRVKPVADSPGVFLCVGPEVPAAITWLAWNATTSVWVTDGSKDFNRALNADYRLQVPLISQACDTLKYGEGHEK